MQRVCVTRRTWSKRQSRCESRSGLDGTASLQGMCVARCTCGVRACSSCVCHQYLMEMEPKRRAFEADTKVRSSVARGLKSGPRLPLPNELNTGFVYSSLTSLRRGERIWDRDGSLIPLDQFTQPMAA